MAPIHLSPEKAEVIVMVCCSLHNFLCTKKNSKPIYAPPGSFDREDSETQTITPGDCRTEQQPKGLIPIECEGSNRNPQSARDVREYLVKYFTSTAGSVPWQDNII